MVIGRESKGPGRGGKCFILAAVCTDDSGMFADLDKRPLDEVILR